MKTQFKLFAFLAVIFISTATALAADKPDSNLTVRAMLVKMEEGLFRQITTDDLGDLRKPGAMEIVSSLFSQTDTTLAAYSQLRINTKVKNAASENKFIDRVRMPIRKAVTGLDTEPYEIFEYSWCENRKHFKIRMLEKSSDDKTLKCECLFEYEISQVVPAQNKAAGFENSDEIIESNFSCNTNLLLNIGETSVAGFQKTGKDCLILLLNISDK
jgi:hypothetical protein